MNRLRLRIALILVSLLCTVSTAGTSQWLSGQRGGRLVTALRSDPKTFNPVAVLDSATREALRPLHADLIHINRESQQPEAALAERWSVSPDGRTIEVDLRPGLKFSDGSPLTVEDVLFTYRVFSDERVASPQRDLLVVGGRPLAVRALGGLKVRFEFAVPYAAGDRLFDGFPILSRAALEPAYRSGSLDKAWSIATPPAAIVGSGPFRLKSYTPGAALVYERNPHYWKKDEAGVQLPYLQELVINTVPSEDTQLLQFNSGAIDVLNRLSPEHFDAIAARGGASQLLDAGASLEYNFLFFNLNDPPAGAPAARSRGWFRDERFRRAISNAVDREALPRLAFRNRGTALWGSVTPGNKRWRNDRLPRDARSLTQAQQLLRDAGFTWDAAGALRDPQGAPVAFTVAVATSNAARMRMAALVVEDLRQLGMNVTVTPLEFRALVDRLYQTHDYEAAVIGFGAGDADPNGDINVWMSTGSSHLWRLRGDPEPWQRELDDRLRRQMGEMKFSERKRLYDEAQQLIAQHQPVIFLASPNILVAANGDLGNFRPAVLEPYTLWNIERLFWRNPRRRASSGVPSCC